MHLNRKNILPALIITCLSLSLLYTAQAASPDAAFQQLQNDLRKEKYKKKVLSRFEVVEGLKGLTLDDISLTLLDYSYHIMNDSGKLEPFLRVQCDIDISRFEKDAEQFKAHLKSMGVRAKPQIQLPDRQRIIFGLIDNEKDEFITFASLPKSKKMTVQFAELRKKKPEYIIFTVEPDESCTDCDMSRSFTSGIFGYDQKNKSYIKILDLKTFSNKSVISWTDWINNEYRELIVTSEKGAMDEDAESQPSFRNKKEIYSWAKDRELVLIERIIDGKKTMSRRPSAASGVDVTLKDGELYEVIGGKRGKKITTTGGKVDGFLLSPGKQYVAYSINVGTYEIVPLEGEGENRPVHNIGIFDLDQNKLLKVIKPPSESEPFLYTNSWISEEELILTEADGFATGLRYVYSAGDNELRTAEIDEMNL